MSGLKTPGGGLVTDNRAENTALKAIQNTSAVL
jgi:hypothetical protein